ncbi:MAG: flagellar motor switch protein FliN [Deltaproteobacteria bacterium]|nr:MAG: flagellar motor switch protein FliN [Deltaproteobacteria bacterium]
MVDSDEKNDILSPLSDESPDQDDSGVENLIHEKASQDERLDDHYEFSDLDGGDVSTDPANIDFLLDIPLEITIELGRTKMLINELLKLGQGSVIELSKFAGETLDIFANQRLIAKGEVVVVNDKYGIRLTEIVTPMERTKRSE